MADKFKFIINTQLKLGSLSELMNEIKKQEGSIRAELDKRELLTLKLGIDQKSKQKFFKDVSRIAEEANKILKFSVDIDNASLGKATQKVKTAMQEQVQQEVRTARDGRVRRSTSASSTSRSTSDSMEANRQARTEKALADADRIRIQNKKNEAIANERVASSVVKIARAKEIHLQIQERIQRVNSPLNRERRGLREASQVIYDHNKAQQNFKNLNNTYSGYVKRYGEMGYEHIPEMSQVRAQMANYERMIREYQGKLQNARVTIKRGLTDPNMRLRDFDVFAPQARIYRSANRQRLIEQMNPQKALMNPDLADYHNEIINRLNQQRAKYARENGVDLPAQSYLVRRKNENGEIATFRTPAYAVSRLGKITDVTTKSFDKLFNHIATRVMIFQTLEMGIASVGEALRTSIEQMTEFQSEFVQLQNVINFRNTTNATSTNATPYSSSTTQRDIMSLGEQWGLNPTTQVLPLYNEIIRRSDIVKNEADAKRFANMVIRAGYVAHGPSLDEKELSQTAEDFMAIYSQHFANNGGMNAMSNYNDYVARLGQSGVNTDKVLSAMGELTPFADTNGLNLNDMTALAGAYELKLPSASGDEIQNTIKTFVNNLMNKHGNGTQIAKALLGITSTNAANGEMPTSLNEMLGVISSRIQNGQLSNSELETIASSLASSGGSNGGNRSGQYMILFQALADYKKIRNRANNSTITADQMAKQNVDTLTGSFRQLNAQLQELAINFGQSGILNGLTAVTQGITSLVGVVNSALRSINDFGTATYKAFGVNVSSVIGSIITMTAALKALQFAYGRLPESMQVLGSLSSKKAIVNGAKNGLSQAAVGEAASGFAPMLLDWLGGKQVHGAKTTKNPLTREFSNFTALFSRKSASSLGSAFDSLIPKLATFGTMLLRLSILGAAISGGVALISFAYQRAKNQRANEYQNFQTTMQDPTKYVAFQKDYAQLINSGKLTGIQRLMAGFNPKNDGFLSKDLVARLKANGIVQRGDGQYSYYYQQDGAQAQGLLDVYNSQSIQLFEQRMKDTNFVIQAQADAFSIAQDHAEQYAISLYDAQQASAKLNSVMQASNIQLSLNDMNYAGAKNSPAYLMNKMNILNNAQSSLLPQLQNAAQTQVSLQQITAGDALNVQKATAPILKKNPALLGEMKRQLMAAIAEGNPDAFLKVYDPKNTENKGSSVATQENYKAAYAMYMQQKDRAAQQQIISENNKLFQQSLNYVQQLKQTYSAYLVAASGANMYEEAMKTLQTRTSALKSAMGWIYNPEQKVSASMTVFGSMATETANLQGELTGITQQMAYIKSQNPNQDFSFSALTNPTKPLSDEQNAYKQLYDQSVQVQSSIASSNDALRQMQEQIVQNMMATDKYKTMWDSVNQTIQLGQTIAKQFRDEQSQEITNGKLISIHQGLQGNAFDVGGAVIQNAQQASSQYQNMYTQAQNALNFSGQDANTLKEAIAELQGGTANALKVAFLDPLSNLVNTTFTTSVNSFGSASSTINQAATIMKNAADELMHYLQTSGNNIINPDTGAPYGAVEGPQVPPQIDPNTGGVKGASYSIPIPSGNGSVTDLINQYATQFGVDPAIIKAIATQESSLGATSNNVMQVNGMDNSTPAQSIKTGTQMFANLLKQTGGNVTNALAAYNMGPGVLDYFAQNGGYSEANMQAYSDHMKKTYGYSGYGDPNYVNHVSQYMPTNLLSNTQDQLKKYQGVLQDYSRKAVMGMIGQQATQVTHNSVDYNLMQSLRNAAIQAQFNGQYAPSDLQGLGGYTFTTQKMSAVLQARQAIASQLYDQQQTVNGFQGDISKRKQELADAQAQGNTKLASTITDEINTIQKLIDGINTNSDQLKQMDEHFAEFLNQNPANNSIVAGQLIQNTIASLDSIRSGSFGDGVGGIQWYKTLKELNDEMSNYLTTQNKISLSQNVYDQTGYGGDRLEVLKGNFLYETLTKLQQQFRDVNSVLASVGEGTNRWQIALQDNVQILQTYTDLENKKTQTDKAYFELSNNGIEPYINSRAYQQSRDYVLAKSNVNTGIYEYNNGFNKDMTEQLTNLQIIAEENQKVIQQMNDYKTAVTQAFQAGAVSVSDYIQKLYDLRNLQQEARDQMVSMMGNVQSGFQSSFSNSLSSALQGNFKSPLEFMSNVKQSLAGSVSSQLTGLIFNNSGLKNVIDSISTTMGKALAHPEDVNTALSAFSDGSIQKQLNDALSPFLPLIEQISASTRGMFTIMNDQQFNAPNGFKIDPYLYDIAKGQTLKSLGWASSGNSGYPAGVITNSAGSPISWGSQKNPAVSQLPAPKGLPTTMTAPTEPVRAMPLGGNVTTNTHVNTIAPTVPAPISTPIAHVAGGLNVMSLSKQWWTNGGMNPTPQQKAIQDQLHNTIQSYNQNNHTGFIYNSDTGIWYNPQTHALQNTTLDAVISIMSANAAKGTQSAHNYNLEYAGIIGANYNASNGHYYLNGSQILHTGGLAGVMNFMNGSGLAPNELSSILQKHEYVFQPPQVASLIGGVASRVADGFSGSSHSEGNITITVPIDARGSNGVDETKLTSAVTEAVKKAMSEIGRSQRLGNLATRGVSYGR